MTDEETPVWRSVSQAKQYLKEHGGCPYQWWLQREATDENGEPLVPKPAAWLAQGSGVHEAAEEWEKSDRTMTLEQTQEVFAESYVKHMAEMTEKTPNFKYWFRSGGYRRSVEDDIERRFGIGKEQVEKYIEYYTKKKPKEVPFVADDGTKAIELPFEFKLYSVWLRGFIDQVIWDPELKQFVVRDIKTGKAPGDEFQLATYKVAVKQKYDIDITWGDYWMAVSGKPTIPYDLTEWPESRVGEEFERADEGIRAGMFDPAPDPDKCKMCSFNAACEYRAAESF